MVWCREEDSLEIPNFVMPWPENAISQHNETIYNNIIPGFLFKS